MSLSEGLSLKDLKRESQRFDVTPNKTQSKIQSNIPVTNKKTQSYNERKGTELEPSERKEKMMNQKQDQPTKKSFFNRPKKEEHFTTIHRTNTPNNAQNDLEVIRNHPEILSKEAMHIINGKKHLFVESVGCPHCQNENKIVNGEFRGIVLKPNDKGKGYILDYKWEEYHKSAQTSQQTLSELETLYKNQKIDKKEFKKLNSDLQHFIGINDVLLDPSINYDKIRKNFDKIYVDDVNSKQEKRAIEYLNNMQKNKTSFDQLYKNIRKDYSDKKDDGEKIVKFIIAKEIQFAYGIRAFPTLINDSCELPKGYNSKSNKKDVLSACKTVGFKDGFAFLEADAEQRKDTQMLSKIEELQVEHKKKIGKMQGIKDINELMDEIKNQQLTER